MRRVGIVDLGSNTIRLVVYACEPEGHYRLVDQIREPVRLAEGSATSGERVHLRRCVGRRPGSAAGANAQGKNEAAGAHGDQKSLEVLTCCLRLAEHLERARANRIKDFEVHVGKRRVELTLIADRPTPVELYEAEKLAWLFEKAFGRRLEIMSS